MPSLLLRDYLWDPWVQPWLIAALFLFWPLRWSLTHQFVPDLPCHRPLLLLLLWTPVGVLASSYPDRSWEALGYLLLGIASYAALVNWPPMQRWPWLVALLIVGIGGLLTGLGPTLLINIPTEFLQFSADVTQSKPVDWFGASETVNPNVLGGILALPLPLLLALLVQTNWIPRRRLRYGWWLLGGLLAVSMLSVLILTQSRGAYLAAAIGLAVVLIWRWPWSSVVLGVMLVAAGAVLSWEGLLSFAEALGSGGSLTSLSGRWEVWQRAVYALRDFPLTGIGFGTFDLVIPGLYPYAIVTNGPQIPHAHNLLLQVGVDLGLPGLLLYTWLLVRLGTMLFRLLRTLDLELDPEPPRRQVALHWALATGTLGALVTLLVHGLADAVVWSTKFAFFPWLFFALVALLYGQHQYEIDFVNSSKRLRTE